MVEQGCKAGTAFNAVNGTIDSMIKTVVFFSLQTGFLKGNI